MQDASLISIQCRLYVSGTVDSRLQNIVPDQDYVCYVNVMDSLRYDTDLKTCDDGQRNCGDRLCRIHPGIKT